MPAPVRVRRLWPLVPALAVVGCFSGEDTRPQPELWAKACALSYAHNEELKADPHALEIELDACEGDYANYPRAIANRTATCAVSLMDKHAPTVPPREAMRSCMGDRANAYFEKRAAAMALLSPLRDAIVTYNGEHEEPAKSFDDANLRTVPGPWGELPRMRYTAPGDWEVCDLGPDRKAMSYDDVCALQPFIFFQF